MNMLYEGMKDKGSLIIVPSSALESMNLGVANLAALQELRQRAKRRRCYSSCRAPSAIAAPTIPGLDPTEASVICCGNI